MAISRDCRNDLVFRLEVLVDAACAETRFGNNVAHRCAVKAEPGEAALGRFEYFRAPLRAPDGGHSRHALPLPQTSAIVTW